MRRSSLNKSEFGLLPASQTIQPPRLREVQDALRPENDVVAQYTPEQLMKIAQRRMQWGEDKRRALTREQQLHNDELAKAAESQQAREVDAARHGVKRGQFSDTTFAVGRTQPLEVRSDGSVVSPTRNQQTRTGLDVRREGVHMDALEKAEIMQNRRKLPTAEPTEPIQQEVEQVPLPVEQKKVTKKRTTKAKTTKAKTTKAKAAKEPKTTKARTRKLKTPEEASRKRKKVSVGLD